MNAESGGADNPGHDAVVMRDYFRIIVCYLVARTVCWTGLLYYTQPTLPMDVLEHLAWGREWQLVYAHHPGLPAWLNEAVNYATGGSRLALSSLSPIFTSLGMAAVWVVARRVAGGQTAAIAVLSLEGVYYFNVAAVEFNHNVLQLAACAWLAAAAFQAFFRGGIWSWIALGAMAAISMYAKYSSVLFLAALFLWSIADSKVRWRWKTSGPAIAFFVFAVLNVPQLASLAELQFAPLQFALARAGEVRTAVDYLLYPLRFAAAQAAAVALAAMLCFLALGRKSGEFSTYQKFIFAVAFGPLILALFISVAGGLKYKSMWGAAMLTFIPLWILTFSCRQLNWRRWQIGFIVVAVIAPLAAIVINSAAPFWNGRGKRVHYPGEEIALKAKELWEAEHEDAPLRYVAGRKHIASLVAYYSSPRLSALIDGDWHKSFWITPEQFAESGGVVVWMIDDGKRKHLTPPSFVNDFSLSGDVTELDFKWRTSANIAPLRVGFALVAPRKD